MSEHLCACGARIGPDLNTCASCDQSYHMRILEKENVWWRRALRFPLTVFIVVVGTLVMPFVWAYVRISRLRQS